MKRTLLTITAVLCLILISCSPKKQETALLFTPATEVDTTLAHAINSTLSISDVDEQKALNVDCNYPAKSPGVLITDTKDSPWNLDGVFQIKADVVNTGKSRIRTEMYVGKDPDPIIRWFTSDYIELEPGEKGTIIVDLAWTQKVLDPQVDLVAMRGKPGIIKTDQSKIHSVRIVSRNPKSASSFSILKLYTDGALEYRDTTDFFPFVDEFGQYKHRNWLNKVHSLDEMKELSRLEDEDLNANPEPSERNKYGGWTAGPQLEATGWFYPTKLDGKWWLVDPEGRLFWSHGFNCTSHNATNTGIDHRLHYFKEIPSDTSEYANFFGMSRWSTHGFYKDKTPFRTYNFYAANLYKKYGDDWLNISRGKIHKRLRSWGVNTVGFMSDHDLMENAKTPYVGGIWIRGVKKIEASEGYWGPIHDVFDPSFRISVKASIEGQKLGAKDPYCIGFYIDNELSWGEIGSLSEAALKSPANQAAKIEFISDLKNKYTTIDKLNKQWETSYKSWNALLQSTQAPEGDGTKEDFEAFYHKIAQTYFQTIRDEIKKVAPNQLYMGCRLAWANNHIVMEAAGEYCDIISFNKYEYSVDQVSLPETVDKPIMIGEFHFGSTDRGCVHPGVKVSRDQADRARMYKDYMASAFSNPNIVGTHWFQYTDQPLTGRGDGENYNVGIVDICDNPYPEMIDAIREVCYDMYTIRY